MLRFYLQMFADVSNTPQCRYCYLQSERRIVHYKHIFNVHRQLNSATSKLAKKLSDSLENKASQKILTENCDTKICCSIGPRSRTAFKVGLQVTISGVNDCPGPQDLPGLEKQVGHVVMVTSIVTTILVLNLQCYHGIQNNECVTEFLNAKVKGQIMIVQEILNRRNSYFNVNLT